MDMFFLDWRKPQSDELVPPFFDLTRKTVQPLRKKSWNRTRTSTRPRTRRRTKVETVLGVRPKLQTALAGFSTKSAGGGDDEYEYEGENK